MVSSIEKPMCELFNNMAFDIDYLETLFNISGEFRREKKKTIVECFLVE
jgi:hypothetical protein